MNIQFLKQIIRNNSSYLLSELETYRIFDEDETQIIDAIENIYKKLSKLTINWLSKIHFKMPIEMAIATKPQETIKFLFLHAAERMEFDYGFQAQIDADLEEIANKLNKRFTFDESSLIHLIEASKASNIQLEEDFQRKSPKSKRQILRQREDGTYYLSEAKGIDIYTTGKSIPTTTITKDNNKKMTKTTIDDISNINISSYPGAKDLIGTASPNEIMKQVMKNLFDNLELCVDTYKFFYTKNPNDSIENSISIPNKAILADDSEFDFYYNINRKNLPHLLGIQNGEILSEETKKYFAKINPDGSIYYPINEKSSALTILKVLLENKDRIISDCGLIKDNGKLYQLFPWEKIILKTSSLMRGDFFKTCFCLIQLDKNKKIFNSNEKFVSISSTEFNKDMVGSQFDAKRELKDLLSRAKHNKDFIFRTFIAQYNQGKLLGYIPEAIAPGKSESIVTNKGERIETLNRYRNALQGNTDNGGMVVQRIENENMKTIFSPIEQALAHINISSSLNINLQISEQTYALEEKLKQMLGEELDKDLQEILAPNLSKGNHITR